MTIKKLVGNAPSQVPRNRDLGTLAYQDATAVRLEQLTVSGNVGIGTTLPVGKLHIETDANSNNTLRIRNLSAGAAAYSNIQTMNDIGNVVELGVQSTTRSTTYPAGEGWLYASNSINLGFIGDVKLYAGSSERMRITSAGNVGIGTTSITPIFGRTLQIGSGTTEGSLSIVGLSGAGFVGTSGSTLNISGRGGMSLVLGTNDVERMRIDSAGNLGLGITPSAWNTSYKVLQVGAGTILSQPLAPAVVDLYANTYIDSAFANRYISTAPASHYEQNGSQHRWYTAPSGTAGNVISFTQAMTLNASGNFLLGTTSDVFGRLQVAGAGGIRVNEDGGGTKVLSLRSDFSGIGPAINVTTTNPLLFLTANTERMRIDASGNVGVGTATPTEKLTVTGNVAVSGTITEAGSPVVVQSDIGTAPNEIPTNGYLGGLAYQNPEAVVLRPQASVTPAGAGDMTFQLTNDTTLVIKVKGSDGVVRSATITLA